MPGLVIHQKLCPHHGGARGNRVQYITVHLTDALAAGCGAAACAQYLYGGHTAAGWHYSVDASDIWQSFRDEQICLHTSGRRDSPGNAASLGITVCAEHKDAFASACVRAAQLTACLMQKHGLPLCRVVPQSHWRGHGDPQTLLRGRWGITWEGFIGLVKQIIWEG